MDAAADAGVPRFAFVSGVGGQPARAACPAGSAGNQKRAAAACCRCLCQQPLHSSSDSWPCCACCLVPTRALPFPDMPCPTVHDYKLPAGWHTEDFLLKGYFKGKRDAEEHMRQVFPTGAWRGWEWLGWAGREERAQRAGPEWQWLSVALPRQLPTHESVFCQHLGGLPAHAAPPQLGCLYLLSVSRWQRLTWQTLDIGLPPRLQRPPPLAFCATPAAQAAWPCAPTSSTAHERWAASRCTSAGWAPLSRR